jgi:multidrug efflux pump subunit AcrB
MNPLPSGVEQESSGDAEVMQDAFSGFAGAVGTAVLFIYAVLVLLFAKLTLVVIPLVFTYMEGLQIWIFNLMRGKKRGEGRSKAT